MAGQLQNFTVDQLAGAVALSLGALGSLLLVIWQSKCRCACRIGISDTCYLFDCSREPPPIDIEQPDVPADEEAQSDDEPLVPPREPVQPVADVSQNQP
jgi:hypothetical protein